jgi:hypothetical protein
MAISADAKRRLRLLYWGATISLTPVLLVSMVAWINRSLDFPNWLIGLPDILYQLES